MKLLKKFTKPIKWAGDKLRLLPYDTRAAIYDRLPKLAALAVAAGVITDGTASVVLFGVAIFLGVFPAFLAHANTPRLDKRSVIRPSHFGD